MVELAFNKSTDPGKELLRSVVPRVIPAFDHPDPRIGENGGYVLRPIAIEGNSHRSEESAPVHPRQEVLVQRLIGPSNGNPATAALPYALSKLGVDTCTKVGADRVVPLLSCGYRRIDWSGDRVGACSLLPDLV